MEFRPNQWQLPFQKPTRLNSVIQPLNSWIKKVTFQPLSLGVVYFRSTRSNEAKKIVKQMNHMKIPGTISAFSPFGKNYYMFPLLDVTFKTLQISAGHPGRCGKTLFVCKGHLPAAKTRGRGGDRLGWLREISDMTWLDSDVFFFIGSIYAMIIHDSISKFWHEYSDSKPNREGYWWIYCITWGQFRFFSHAIVGNKTRK